MSFLIVGLMVFYRVSCFSSALGCFSFFQEFSMSSLFFVSLYFLTCAGKFGRLGCCYYRAFCVFVCFFVVVLHGFACPTVF